MNGLDLFSGIGGMSIALESYVKTVAYCESEKYCQAVLLSRMDSRDVEYAPIWDDIRTLRGSYLHETIDIITGGFPCQNISTCGDGKGLDGERSGLFFEILRICKETQPKFLFLENVPAITARGGIRCVTEIASLGYDCRWLVLSASEVGAKHKRERWFLLAYAKGKRLEKAGFSVRKKEALPIVNNETKYDSWNKEPENKFELVRMADGLQCRSHRIKALGNSVVPAQAKKAFEMLMGLK